MVSFLLLSVAAGLQSQLSLNHFHGVDTKDVSCHAATFFKDEDVLLRLSRCIFSHPADDLLQRLSEGSSMHGCCGDLWVSVALAHPEDVWNVCIIHDAALIFSCSGLLFGDIKQELLSTEASASLFSSSFNWNYPLGACAEGGGASHAYIFSSYILSCEFPSAFLKVGQPTHEAQLM